MDQPRRSAVAGLVLATVLLAAAACSREPSEAEQARELLAAISALDPGASATMRARQLATLEALPVRWPELARTRAQCVAAHRGLLRAEQQQERARNALNEAVARHGDSGIPPDQTKSIAALIERSNSALAEAQQALPDCDEKTLELAKRYR